MTSTLLFFHLFGMTVILGILGTLLFLKGQEEEMAPTWVWVFAVAIAITWPLWLTALLVFALWTYAAYHIEEWARARKPPSPGGPDPGAEPPP